MTNDNNLFTFKQFIEKNLDIGRWPFTEGNLRTLYRRRKENGLEEAFLKIGGRLLVDEEKFYKSNKR